MARARNIKPGFFQNEELADLSVEARLFFIGLWTIADFKGCLEYRPKRIKVAILPYDDQKTVQELVDELESAGFVRTYEVNKIAYLKVENFIKHQHPHKNEIATGSDIPDVPNVVRRKGLRKKPESIGTTSDSVGTTPPDSLNPLTLTGFPQGGTTSSSAPTEPAADAAPDPVQERIWKDGRDLLTRSGVKDPGPVLGKWVKDFGKAETAAAIASAQATNAADPKTYIFGILRGKGKPFDPGKQPEPDYTPAVTCGHCGEDYCLKDHREAIAA
jgi:uncharacterized protein YlbG (UPF0298 family)